jgi:hypothetical protein
MTTSDALVVGEDFISEHYFSTDAKSQSFQAKVLERRKEWDAAKDAGHPTPLTRYSEERGALAKDFNGLWENADEDVLDPLYARLRALLGFDSSVRWDVNRLGGSETAEGPVVAYRARDLTGPAPFVIVDARGGLAVEDLLAKDEKTLLRAFRAEDEVIESAAKLLSRLFVADDGPQFALVMAGGTALVTERERWLEGRYLAIDLQLVGERNDTKRGGEIDRALTCLSADSLAPDAEGNLWWSSVIDESIKHTVGVSEDLREGVRLSIEIIANEVVARRGQKGMDSLPADQAQPLARQSLRFLYRILFLLYAEASPELAVLPVGLDQYERGYSLDRLRELTLVQLASPRAQLGTHLFDSLVTLFELVDSGHEGSGEHTDEHAAAVEGLTFRSLKADLFLPSAIALIDEVKLGNQALQRVLGHLLLSKEAKGRDRGFISYAQLGINQLGAVYEGLMSYTGFFAAEDLYEVAKNGDSSKGSWVVPSDRIASISESDFVRVADELTGEPRPVVHERGTFVFRLAGRERQQSASYYSPEVLTRFVVGQALDELVGHDRKKFSANDILELTVCEPALGSGAFAIEAVQQLAERYLSRRQGELGTRIDPDEYAAELQRVKAYIALHNVYGVDLNASAVEFAEISLWLATMGEGLAAPWFGLHLRRGNSLVGTRRAVIPRAAVSQPGWMQASAVDLPLDSHHSGPQDAVHHFLLPADGWGSTVDAKEAKDMASEAMELIKAWRKMLRHKLGKSQVATLGALARRTERMWLLTLKRLEIAEFEVRRSIPVWGLGELPSGGGVSREAIEASLADPTGAYRRLRRVMDAWCALWFWPLTEEARTVDSKLVTPPSIDEWIDALQQLLGLELKVSRRDAQQFSLTDIDDWDDLEAAEANDLAFAQAKPPADVLTAHPWLVVCERIAERQGFFHWALDFAPSFARGGFDFIIGNPPWVRPDFDEKAALAEFDVSWAFDSKIATDRAEALKKATLEISGADAFYIDELTTAVTTRAFLSDSRNYPHLEGLRPDLYRCFMEQTWRHVSAVGVISLIHPETHFTDENAGELREAAYLRLRRHWQFVNELQFFEISNHVAYGIHVYGPPREPNFLQASSLYHPETIVRSLIHDGSGPPPGLKDADGRWDLRPHASRIVAVTDELLAAWNDALERPGVPTRQARMLYTVNASVANVLEKLSLAPRLRDQDLRISLGWDENAAFRKGYFTKSWGVPESWADVILQGPHLFVATPLYKVPNPTMKSNRDWSATDFESLQDDAIPATSYKPTGARARYDNDYTSWEVVSSNKVAETVHARECWRIGWRRMAAITGERTLIPALLPPGSAHVDGICSMAIPTEPNRLLLRCMAGMHSLISDFNVRSVLKGDIRGAAIERLPFVSDSDIGDLIVLRSLRLNCVTSAYAEIWCECYDDVMQSDNWAGGFQHARRKGLSEIGPEWTHETPLRIAADRRQALVEIDALVALGLGLTADELCTIYRTQFPVLYGYDHNSYLYDVNGRLVPRDLLVMWRAKGDGLSMDDRTAVSNAGTTYMYQPPFRFLDREVDMRAAYQEFEKRLATERSG